MVTPALRKLLLTAHVTSSVGWLGAVAAFLALAIAGVSGEAPERVRAAYVAMELTGWFVIVPLSFASLVTGVVQGWSTEWGLLQHYWVAIKLWMTALATIVLLVHMRPISHVARVAGAHPLSSGELQNLRLQLVGDATAALVVLLVATALSVYKPRGRTQLARHTPAG